MFRRSIPKSSIFTFIVSAGLLAIPVLAQDGAETAEQNPRWSRLLERLDTDGNGQIDRGEFERGDERFNRADRNDDGVLTADDFVGIRSREHRRAHGPRGAHGGALIGLADADGSGDVTSEEWQSFAAGLDANGDGVLAEDEMPSPKGRRGGRRGGGHRGGLGGDERSAEGAKRGAGILDVNQNGSLEVDELAVIFEAADLDSDGTVSREEMPRRRGPGNRGPGRRGGGPAMHLLKKADADQDRQLSVSEWKAFISGLDVDGDAVLSSDELATLRPDDAPPQRRGDLALETSRLEELFNHLDADSDGVISEQEWPRRRGPRGPRGGRGLGR